MIEDGKRHEERLLDPARPPLAPGEAVRRLKLRPNEMTAAVTATDDLFVLAHFGIPHVDVQQWSLVIDGLVGRAGAMTLDELKARPKKIVETVHQCAGNPLAPNVPTRRIANVRWGGVDLGVLFEEIGIDPGARFLWSYGLDGGEFAGATCDWFVKDLPLERLAAGDVLLAYELNGAPLSAEHGFPLRLVVPGYYGTNSVKWLWRLHLAEERAEGLFTTRYYNDQLGAADVAAGIGPRRPVWALAPDSIIVAPAPDTVLAVGEPTTIWGWAWSFRGISEVLVSIDDGAGYMRAALDERCGWAWQRFSVPWRPSERGTAGLRLLVCAVEAGGVAQPAEGARNAIHAVRVLVQ